MEVHLREAREADLAVLQAPDGSTVPAESLGPGIVSRAEPDGRLWVHWVGADFDACLDASDVVEVAPPFDPSGNTALVGVTMMFEILCVLAERVAECRRK